MSSNITGSKRLIRDHCVDMYNYVQKWRNLSSDSHSIILSVWKVKEEGSLMKLTNEGHLNADYSPESFSKLENLSSALHNNLERLKLIVKGVKSIVTKMSAISELSDLHQSNSFSFSSVSDQIPFETCQFSNFCAVAEKIATMLEEEFKIKSCICKDICSITDKSNFLFLEACWKWEPNIDRSILNMLLDGIIYELGLFSEII